MQTISVTLRAIGSTALQIEVFAKPKALKVALEEVVKEALGCKTEEGPDFKGGYPYYLILRTAAVLEVNQPQSNWYITYWDTASQPWELRYNRPDKVSAIARKRG